MFPFQFKLKILHEPITMDGVLFKNCAIIELFIDEKNITQTDFKGSFIHFDELKSSTQGTGKFLIFTCACGVADDAGWQRINVIHQHDQIDWQFTYNEKSYNFIFDKLSYLREINQLNTGINKLTNEIRLEPVYVTFPEDEIGS